MKVYLAQYNDCIFESSFATLSIHFSKEGAEKTVQGMVEKLKQEKLLTPGDVFVTTLSIPAHTTKKTNTVQLGIVE
jgi:hypothetical protein